MTLFIDLILLVNSRAKNSIKALTERLVALNQQTHSWRVVFTNMKIEVLQPGQGILGNKSEALEERRRSSEAETSHNC